MTLCVLAAGLGSRYGSLKQLDPMTDEGEFIIDFSVYDAMRAGFDTVVFIIKEENLRDFKETIGDRIGQYMKVEYVFQKPTDLPGGFKPQQGRTKPYGTAQATYALRDAVKDGFAIINADDYYGPETFELLADFLKNKAPGPHYCMVGYELGKTLTEHGTVSRGICEVSADGYLQSVTERTAIRPEGDHAVFTENGVDTVLPLTAPTSMNCWGLTADFFEPLTADLIEFLQNLSPEQIKAEFYLPTAVDLQRKRGECDVKVLHTSDAWFGVTYAEDKPKVYEKFKALKAAGVYPEYLWKKVK